MGFKLQFTSRQSTTELLAELLRKQVKKAFIFKKTEHIVVKKMYSGLRAEERDRLFKHTAATVWKMVAFEKYASKKEALTVSGALREEIINAFVAGASTRWKN